MTERDGGVATITSRIEDEAKICAQVLCKSAGTISGIRSAPPKSYTKTVIASPKFMQEMEIFRQ